MSIYLVVDSHPSKQSLEKALDGEWFPLTWSTCTNTLTARYILLQPDGPPSLQPASNDSVDPMASMLLPEVVTNGVVLACTILPHCDCSLWCVRTGTKRGTERLTLYIDGIEGGCMLWCSVSRMMASPSQE